MKRLIKANIITADNEFVYKLANDGIYRLECSEEGEYIEENRIYEHWQYRYELAEAVKNDDIDFVEYFDRYNDDLPEGSLKSITVEFDTSSCKLITTITANQELNQQALSILKDYMIGQFSDGWGEGFEQSPIYEYDDDWSIETEVYDEEEDDYFLEDETITAHFYVYVSFWGKGITYDWI